MRGLDRIPDAGLQTNCKNKRRKDHSFHLHCAHRCFLIGGSHAVSLVPASRFQEVLTFAPSLCSLERSTTKREPSVGGRFLHTFTLTTRQSLPVNGNLHHSSSNDMHLFLL